MYPYVVAVATPELLRRERFFPFLRFARQSGAYEVHLLEPSLTGKLAGRKDIALPEASRRRILDYQREVAADESLPILSSFTYLEGADAFGCGAVSFATTPSALKTLTSLSQAGRLSIHDGNPLLSDGLSQVPVQGSTRIGP